MMKAVPNSAQGKLIVLAPQQSSIPEWLENVSFEPDRHEQLLASMQRLRGGLYLEEGAIQRSQLSFDGRHRQPVDERAWHLLAINNDGEVYGCARYMQHPNTAAFSQLDVCRSALASSHEWGTKLRAAVESEIELARGRGVAYVEVGGWALAPELRCTMEALRIALASYSLASALGGCIGIGMVTRRHRSSSILRRIGGRPLIYDGVELPSYFDPQFQCQMEMLRFDSTDPNPRFEIWIRTLANELATTPVIRPDHSLLRLHNAITDQNREAAGPSSPLQTSEYMTQP
jgi:hypothetical protein